AAPHHQPPRGGRAVRKRRPTVARSARTRAGTRSRRRRGTADPFAPRGYLAIENYGVIGDLETVALVGMDGSIDFLCFPRSAPPSVSASLSARHQGGRFQIAPVLPSGDVRHKQLYLPDSAVLLTRFLAADGVAEISDLMPVAESGGAHCVVRRVKAVRG